MRCSHSSSVCVYWGLQYTSASRAIVFLYLAPFIVALACRSSPPPKRLRAAQIAALRPAFGALAFAFRAPPCWHGRATVAPVAGRLPVGDRRRVLGLTTLWIRAALRWPAPRPSARCSCNSRRRPRSWRSPPCWPGRPDAATGFDAGLALLGHPFSSVVIAFASYLTWFWLLRHDPVMVVSAFTFLTPVLDWSPASCCWASPSRRRC